MENGLRPLRLLIKSFVNGIKWLLWNLTVWKILFFNLIISITIIYMEYTEFLGTYADIPVDIIVAGWEKAYGREKVQTWISEMEEAQGKTIWNFYQEDIV